MNTLTTPTRVEGTLDPLLGSDGLPWPQTFDGQTWAKEFIRHVHERPEIATDEGTMIGWFANAIMVGYDRAKQEPNARPHAEAVADSVQADVRCADCGRMVPRLEATEQTTFEGTHVRCETCGDAAYERSLQHHGKRTPNNAVRGRRNAVP